VDREDALRRLRRALLEFRIEGVTTTLPFFEAILEDEAFVKGRYTTRFVAERLGELKIKAPPIGESGVPPERDVREVQVEVNGKLFRVKVYADETRQQAAGAPVRRRERERGRGASVAEGTITAPMQGTIVKVFVEEGQKVAVDETVCLLEAMKMESEIRAKKDGLVAKVLIEAGKAVRSGDPLVVLE
jgi:acetyl-CoA/propionyl-CoA carboxylase biotin carboxyl carrier protein